jgi:dethiobiotin synthetase
MCKVNLRGIILSCSQADHQDKLNDLAPVELIQSLTGVRVLGILPYLRDITDRDKLAQAAANLDLELILPV